MKTLHYFFLFIVLFGFCFTACEETIDPNKQIVNPAQSSNTDSKGIAYTIPAISRKFYHLPKDCIVEYSVQKTSKLPQVRLSIKAGYKVKNSNSLLSKEDSIFIPYMVITIVDTVKIKINNIYSTNQYSIDNRYVYISSVTFYNTENNLFGTNYSGVYASEITRKGHIIIRKLEQNSIKTAMIVEGTFEAEVRNTHNINSSYLVTEGKFSLEFITTK